LQYYNLMHQGIIILIYLFYGLSFFILGLVSILLYKGKTTTDRFLRNLLYLGFFGLLHGFAEWGILLRESGLFDQHSLIINSLIFTFNALSFFILAFYGFLMTKDRNIHILTLWSLFTLSVLLILYFQKEYLPTLPKLADHSLRWLIGTPSALFAGFGLWREGKDYRFRQKYILSRPLLIMSALFILYGISVSMVPPLWVSEKWYMVPIFSRITIAVSLSINVLILGFRVKKLEDDRFWAYKEYEIKHRERERLRHELHDRVLQKLFATGLTIDRCLEEESKDKEELKTARALVSESSVEIRRFLNENINEVLSLGDFLNLVLEECSWLNRTLSMNIKLNTKEIIKKGLTDYSLSFSHDLLTIMQEAVTNSVKHSPSSTVIVSLKIIEKRQESNGIIAMFLLFQIKDNGIGFDINKKTEGLGLKSMRQRAENMDTDFQINSDSGTEISLHVPLLQKGIENHV
jgi:two-component system, NarL family, sensor histidine kinase YdfH